MNTSLGLATFLDTLKTWLSLARDDEVLALSCLVATECERRGLSCPCVERPQAQRLSQEEPGA